MAVRSSRWCARCRKVHAGDCPSAPIWQKPVGKQSGRGGRPWQRKRAAVFERDGFLCQICMRVGVVRVVTLHGSLAGVCDHIIPLAEGGSDRESNLQAICQQCDREKTHAESIKGRSAISVK